MPRISGNLLLPLNSISSPFLPSSPQAAVIAHLLWVTFGICAVILLLVSGLITYICIRFRARPTDQGDPPPIYGNRQLEYTWTAIPLLIILILFILTVGVMRASDPAAVAADAKPDLIIRGHQWWWEIIYPDLLIVTANEVRLQTGKRYLVRLESEDVVHDFWAPQLGPKKDMLPGTADYIWLQADQPGVYLGTCAEYCGNQHAWMRIRVIAQNPSDFDSWQKAMLRPSTINTASAAKGAALFAQRTCVNCHHVQGQPGIPRIGPDLTHLELRQTLATGVLDNTPKNLAHWLDAPQLVKPGCYMPNFNLTQHDVVELVDYLEESASK